MNREFKVLRAGARWQDLRLYKKSDALYQFTVVFCRRFLPTYGDRTVDQMIQAARSGKQNIVEGSEDGKTSTEMELKLINVARASISELREDYKDFITSHNLPVWETSHPRFQGLQEFTKQHNEWDDYEKPAETWTQEEMANIGLTLCYQMDTMINRYLNKLEKIFVEEGGIKERMYKARTGYRTEQDEELKRLKEENTDLRQQLSSQQAAYQDLKQRALAAYNKQKQRIEELEKIIESYRSYRKL